jgi:ketosteroid isomerase-like protein
MKYVLFVFLLVFICHDTYAQSKDSTLIVQVVESFRKALIDADKTKLDELLSDKLSYGHSGGKIDTKTSLEESLVSGASDFVTIELKDQTIQIVGKNAIVRHKLYATTNDAGKPGEVKLSVLLVWQKSHHTWKLIARQAIKII